jgi:hypothetical protein
MQYDIIEYKYYANLPSDIITKFIDKNEYTYHIKVTHKDSYALNLIRNYILDYYPIKCFVLKKETYQNTVVNGITTYYGYLRGFENQLENIPINQNAQIDSEYQINIKNTNTKSMSVFSNVITSKNKNIDVSTILNQKIYLCELMPNESIYADLEIKERSMYQGPGFANGLISRKDNTIFIPVRCVAKSSEDGKKYFKTEFQKIISSLNYIITNFNNDIISSIDLLKSNVIQLDNDYSYIIPYYRNKLLESNLKYIVTINEVSPININNKMIINEKEIDFVFLKKHLENLLKNLIIQ